MSQPEMKVINEDEVQKLHQQSLKIFEKTGIKVTHKEALSLFKKAGARVDEQTETVRFPRSMVEELLSQAPATAVFEGINGQRIEIGGMKRYYSSLVTDPWINDFREGRRRPKLEDIRRHTIIGESLGRISGMMRMQFPVTDIPEPDCYYKTMEVFLCHLTKHVSIYPASAENGREWIEVYENITDAMGMNLHEHPLLSIAMAVTSPLQVHGVNIELMKMAIDYGFPIISTVCPMAGTTSPYSVAGSALIGNVEALAPVLIAQVFKPGHPVLYSFCPSETDLKSGQNLYYKAEKMLFKIICCQMGQFYKLPVSGTAAGSLTYRPDVQNGAEGIANLLASHLGGQNWIGGVGSMDNANGMSAEQIIMQCGLIDMAEYLTRGVDMSDYKMAFESIHKQGPGGNYLVDDLTLELMHSDEFFNSEYFDLSGGYDTEAPSMYEKAHAKAEKLIESYKSKVPDKVIEAIKKYFRGKYKDKTLASK